MSTGAGGPGERRPTLASIAARAGVSHQTVANTLNSPDKVAPATRERVLEVVRELNYRPNETARSLARRSTRLISFHLGTHHDVAAMLDPFMRELALAGRAHGYRVVVDIAGDGDDEQIASYEELSATGAVDGFVIPETHVGDRRPAWLVEHGVPVVAFGRPWSESAPRHSWVDVDGAHGMALVADHLRDAGHDRIVYLGPPRDGGMEDDRLDGLLAGVARSGGDPGSVVPVEVHRPADLWTTLPALLDDVRPTALACRDDSFAFEAIQVLTEHGIRAGHDIAVTGFDDSDLAARCRPQITSVAQPVAEVAQLIWTSLLAQFAHEDVPPLQRLTLPTLTVRGSTAPA